MKKIELGDAIVLTLISLVLALIILFVPQIIRLKQEREDLKVEIQELNREIGEYKAMEDFYWDFAELLDEIYDGKIKEAVLIERVYWLKQYTEWLEEQETVSDGYTQEEMYEVIEQMIGLMLEVDTDEMLDVDYNQETKIFVVIQYNQYGELHRTQTYTLDEIIHEILG